MQQGIERDIRAQLDLLADPTFDGPRQTTYVALDYPTWDAAAGLVDSLGHVVDGYKVGLELFHGDGTRALTELARRGKRVFLDVKLHDIPNTVAGALRAICHLPGIEMVNVHASGGHRMMVAAREAVDAAAEGGGSRPKLIAVTVLTSLDEGDFDSLGWHDPAASMVLRLASLAASCRLDGVVASAREISVIRERQPSEFEIVVPGTRPVGVDANDQKRTMTPGEAYAAGASRLVLGRAVTGAPNPVEALAHIWTEMRDAARGTA